MLPHTAIEKETQPPPPPPHKLKHHVTSHKNSKVKRTREKKNTHTRRKEGGKERSNNRITNSKQNFPAGPALKAPRAQTHDGGPGAHVMQSTTDQHPDEFIDPSGGVRSTRPLLTQPRQTRCAMLMPTPVAS